LKESILVLDVGNSNIAIGVYQGTKLCHHWRVATDRKRTGDELGMLLGSLFADEGFDKGILEGVVLSSVVPPAISAVEYMCARYLKRTPLIVGPGIRTGLVIKYENPRDVGADRIANAVAAIEQYGAPVIIVDLGTATTFTVIDEKANYLGGVIAPGIQISTDALFQRADKLPRIELTKPGRVVGKNTVSSMQSGVYYGFAGLVDGIINKISDEWNLPFRVIATGGMAGYVAAESSLIQDISPHLTLEGLRILWERNR
jgi:type III pantothenate kinase